MTTATIRTVEDLKVEGKFFAAGALLAQLGGYPRSYGCHLGMRSTLESDRAEFYRGYDAATTGAVAVKAAGLYR